MSQEQKAFIHIEFQHKQDELERALEVFRHRRHEEIVARLTKYLEDLFTDIRKLDDRYRERFFASPTRIGTLFRGHDIRLLFEKYQNSGTIDVQYLVNNGEESQQQQNESECVNGKMHGKGKRTGNKKAVNSKVYLRPSSSSAAETSNEKDGKKLFIPHSDPRWRRQFWRLACYDRWKIRTTLFTKRY